VDRRCPPQRTGYRSCISLWRSWRRAGRDDLTQRAEPRERPEILHSRLSGAGLAQLVHGPSHSAEVEVPPRQRASVLVLKERISMPKLQGKVALHARFSAPRKCVLSSSFCPMAASAEAAIFQRQTGPIPHSTPDVLDRKNGARNGSPGACFDAPFGLASCVMVTSGHSCLREVSCGCAIPMAAPANCVAATGELAF
jgi:hypothetical protein